MNKNILIVAGEPSGDLRASELLIELKKIMPDAYFWGIGGDRMEKQGVELVEHIRHLSIIGVWEAVKNVFKIRKQYKDLIKHIQKRKPDLAILVDYPGFNLHLASFLHKKNIPIIYYIIPQVWAWGFWRIKSLKRFVNKALVLFKFEEDLLKNKGIDCEFVGHPIVDAVKLYKLSTIHDSRLSAEALAKAESTNHDPRTIALLPGSRKSEIQTILPIILGAAKRIYGNFKNIEFIIAENSNINKSLYDSILAKYNDLPIQRVTDNTFLCLDKCSLAIVASGTATLETSAMEKSMVVVYKTSPVTAFIARLVAKVPPFAPLGLVNIIAGEEIVPELIQEDLTEEKLSQKVIEMINNEMYLQKIREKLQKVSTLLGEEGSSRKAAEAVKRFIVNQVKMGLF